MYGVYVKRGRILHGTFILDWLMIADNNHASKFAANEKLRCRIEPLSRIFIG